MVEAASSNSNIDFTWENREWDSEAGPHGGWVSKEGPIGQLAVPVIDLSGSRLEIKEDEYFLDAIARGFHDFVEREQRPGGIIWKHIRWLAVEEEKRLRNSENAPTNKDEKDFEQYLTDGDGKEEFIRWRKHNPIMAQMVFGVMHAAGPITFSVGVARGNDARICGTDGVDYWSNQWDKLQRPRRRKYTGAGPRTYASYLREQKLRAALRNGTTFDLNPADAWLYGHMKPAEHNQEVRDILEKRYSSRREWARAQMMQRGLSKKQAFYMSLEPLKAAKFIAAHKGAFRVIVKAPDGEEYMIALGASGGPGWLDEMIVDLFVRWLVGTDLSTVTELDIENWEDLGT